MMADERDEIPVSILFLSSIDGIGRFNRPFYRHRRWFKRSCRLLSMLQRRKETSISGKVRFCDLYWAVCSRWSNDVFF